MFQESDYRENISLKLSEVLDDIGVNERRVMRMRRINMMGETMNTITSKSIGDDINMYYLGSQSEGTTTAGLNSDSDILVCFNDVNVIQYWSEWEQGKRNLLMILNEDTTPGYCFLQLLRSDAPLPETVIPDEGYTTDIYGRILHTNIIQNNVFMGAEQHGPSLASPGQQGMRDRDIVIAYPCKSWPQSASGWLEGRGMERWPTQEMKGYAASTGCFVVPTGSKVGNHPELEWRISTTLAERCLMYDLNITQIRCYVLLKMVLKSLLNPHREINISSFMCKTVLLRSIGNTEPCIWTENNLLTCLTYCLLELQSCVRNEHCPHFIISENNLMAGQFNVESKQQLLTTLCDFVQSEEQRLLQIDIDDVGLRLQVKMNILPLRIYHFHSSLEICEHSSAVDFINLAYQIHTSHLLFIKKLNDKNIEMIKQTVARLMPHSNSSNQLEYASCMFIAPFLFTTLGSAIASSNIGENNQVSPEALVWLSAGLNSDVSSSRLKLASIIYCTGDMERTEHILLYIETQYNSFPILPICACFKHPLPDIPPEFKRVCNDKDANCIKHITAFCVIFSQKEINCVPRELQYEMFRSTQDDMLHRHPIRDRWMNFAVVDCLTYLYFLQYKTNGHLGRRQDQQQALSNLIKTVYTERNLGHLETALNILGQCMEQENRPQVALWYYMLSLRQRARNNAASVHICRLLNDLLTGQ